MCEATALLGSGRRAATGRLPFLDLYAVLASTPFFTFYFSLLGRLEATVYGGFSRHKGRD